MKKKLGFTLIELLVVISIISILVSLSLVSLGGAQKQARDASRKSDLAQYRNALESFAGYNSGKYPGFGNNVVVTIKATNLCGASYLSPFLGGTCLADPIATGTCGGVATDFQYCYVSDGDAGVATAINYLLFVHLETGGYWEVCSNGRAGKVIAVPASVTCGII